MTTTTTSLRFLLLCLVLAAAVGLRYLIRRTCLYTGIHCNFCAAALLADLMSRAAGDVASLAVAAMELARRKASVARDFVESPREQDDPKHGVIVEVFDRADEAPPSKDGEGMEEEGPSKAIISLGRARASSTHRPAGRI